MSLSQMANMLLPKQQGGLGVTNLEIFNIALLAKWIWKLEDEEGLWQDIIRSKYIKDKCLSEIKYKNGDSQFWPSLLKIRKFVYSHIKKTG